MRKINSSSNVQWILFRITDYFWMVVLSIQKRGFKTLLAYLGPGFLVAIAYIDPGNCK